MTTLGRPHTNHDRWAEVIQLFYKYKKRCCSFKNFQQFYFGEFLNNMSTVWNGIEYISSASKDLQHLAIAIGSFIIQLFLDKTARKL